MWVQTYHLEIDRGVRQGIGLYSLVFSLLSNSIFNTALADVEVGIKVNEKLISVIRYVETDRFVIFADNMESLQLFLTKVNTVDEEMGRSINISRTKSIGQRMEQIL